MSDPEETIIKQTTAKSTNDNEFWKKLITKYSFGKGKKGIFFDLREGS